MPWWYLGCFPFDFESSIRISEGYETETYEVLTAKCPTAALSRRHRPRTVLSCPMGFYPTLWESITRWPSDYAINKAYPNQITVLAVEVMSPKRLLQLCQTFSSSVYFSILLNCLVRFWILYLWVKGNPKKFDIRNKCSKMCVCRIMLQNIYVNIQKIEL